MEIHDTISKHFKVIENKADSPKFQIRNIDFIYLINLDKRPQRLKQSLDQLAPYQIKPHRMSAVDGWTLSQDAFDDIAMRIEPGMEYDQPVQVGFRPGNFPATAFTKALEGKCCLHSQAPAGGIGCTLSHLSIFHDAYEAGYETIWVVEDDFTINGDPHDLALFIDRLDTLVGKNGWDLLYTDDDSYYTPQNVYANCGSQFWLRPGVRMTSRLIQRTPIGEDFFKIGGRTQTHSYLARRDGMKKVLDSAKKNHVFFPIDTEFACVEGLNIYNMKYDLIHGRDRVYSDTYCRIR